MAKTTVRKFSVFHPIEGKINTACTLNYSYEYITSVTAESLVKSLSIVNDPVLKLKRKTSTGDLILVEDKLYMVSKNLGFKRIPKSKSLYKDVTELDEAIIEILSRKTLSEEDVNILIDNCY